MSLIYYDDLNLVQVGLWGLANVTADLAQFAQQFFTEKKVLRRVISLTVNATFAVSQEACWVLCSACSRANITFLSQVLDEDFLRNVCSALKEIVTK